MATVYVYGASIDENGKAHGGQAGNQTGRELKKQKWYKHDKTWPGASFARRTRASRRRSRSA